MHSHVVGQGRTHTITHLCTVLPSLAYPPAWWPAASQAARPHDRHGSCWHGVGRGMPLDSGGCTWESSSVAAFSSLHLMLGCSCLVSPSHVALLLCHVSMCMRAPVHRSTCVPVSPPDCSANMDGNGITAYADLRCDATRGPAPAAGHFFLTPPADIVPVPSPSLPSCARRFAATKDLLPGCALNDTDTTYSPRLQH